MEISRNKIISSAVAAYLDMIRFDYLEARRPLNALEQKGRAVTAVLFILFGSVAVAMAIDEVLTEMKTN
jgi:hypothetical protein